MKFMLDILNAMICNFMADMKGRDVFCWTIAGFTAGPVAIIVLALLSDRKKE